MLVSSSSHVIEFFGPYFANGHDARIMKDEINDQQKIKNFLRKKIYSLLTEDAQMFWTI